MGFGTSDPRIYKKMNWQGSLKGLTRRDVLSQLAPIEAMGFRWSADTGRLVRPGPKMFMSYNTPWCHARHLVGKHCALDHQITFNAYGIIPKRCLSCWKTVLTPKNFDELMIWKEVQENDIPYACKCGTEMRDYTPKHYGAYHYAGSLDEGREQYEDVVKKAKKYLSPETAEGVILKRGCTEFEMIVGPASHWHLTKEQERFLEIIEAYVELPQAVGTQKAITKPFVMLKWSLWAHANGDFSYMKYNGGQKLFPDYQKFHEGDLNAIKHDLAICAGEMAGVPQEVTEEYLMGASTFLEDHGFTLDQMARTIGSGHFGKLGTTHLSDVKKIDPITMGDADIQPNEISMEDTDGSKE